MFAQDHEIKYWIYNYTEGLLVDWLTVDNLCSLEAKVPEGVLPEGATRAAHFTKLTVK